MKGKQIFAVVGLTVLVLLLNQTISELYIDTNIRNVSALTPHARIQINSDDDFVALGLPGNGNKNNPYLITNYLISVSTSYAIYIAQTTKHFRIVDCHIEIAHYGIYITDVAPNTCEIENNTIDIAYKGISVSNSENSYIVYNNITSEAGGVGLHAASGTIVEDNFITSKDEDIYITESTDVNMRNNVFSGEGIYLQDNLSFSTLIASNNTLNGKDLGYFRDQTDLHIVSPSYSQLLLYQCSDVLIENQDCANVSFAFDIHKSGNITINNCFFEYDYDFTLNIEDSNDITIKNSVFGTSSSGILLYMTNNTIVRNNSFTSCNDGIQVSGPSINHLIDNNTLTEMNGYGIYVSSINNATITNNYLSLLSQDGIEVYDSDNCIISNNNCSLYSGAGIEAYDIDNCLISNNVCTDSVSYCGIEVVGTNSIIYNNTALRNEDGGIFLEGSNLTAYENTARFNFLDGIYGFYLENSSITQNILTDNQDYGMSLDGCSRIQVSNNNCSNNGNYGIFLDNSDICNISLNQILNNSVAGIYLDSSVNNNVTSNDCLYNGYGISLSFHSHNTLISFNNCSRNNFGMMIDSSENCDISNNNITENNYDGINVCFNADQNIIRENFIFNNTRDGIKTSSLDFVQIQNNLIQRSGRYGICSAGCASSIIVDNTITNSLEYAIYLSWSADNHIIYHNNFIQNNLLGTSQAFDRGSSNVWFNETLLEGNIWDDWDNINNYSIDGTANSEDIYPYFIDEDNDGMPDTWEELYGLNTTVDDSGLDPDNDSLTNLNEFLLQTNPINNDTDYDLMLDSWEVTHGLNPLVDDSVLDDDSDGLSNLEEFNLDTNPLNNDTDHDLLLDGWEVTYGLDPLVNDSPLDFDSDGLSNIEEFSYNTLPNNNDTDSDGLLDGDEIFVYLTNPSSNDTDGDLLLDNQEVLIYDTDPTLADSDDDGLTDYEEIIIWNTNATNSDTDYDGMDDYWEITIGLNATFNDANLDYDSDGLTNFEEYVINLDPLDSDSDNDGMPDGYEVDNGLNPNLVDSGHDPDSDGLTNYAEYLRGTDPQDADSDNDMIPDGAEVQMGLNPLVHDSAEDPDDDGLNNYWEYILGTDISDADTDNDGLTDGEEHQIYSTNPLNADSDNDGLTDYEECIEYLTDPNDKDSDNDGLTDYEEIMVYGTNPNMADTDGDSMSDGNEIALGNDPLKKNAYTPGAKFALIAMYTAIGLVALSPFVVSLVIYLRRKIKKKKLWETVRFDDTLTVEKSAFEDLKSKINQMDMGGNFSFYDESHTIEIVSLINAINNYLPKSMALFAKAEKKIHLQNESVTSFKSDILSSLDKFVQTLQQLIADWKTTTFKENFIIPITKSIGKKKSFTLKQLVNIQKQFHEMSGNLNQIEQTILSVNSALISQQSTINEFTSSGSLNYFEPVYDKFKEKGAEFQGLNKNLLEKNKRIFVLANAIVILHDIEKTTDLEEFFSSSGFQDDAEILSLLLEISKQFSKAKPAVDPQIISHLKPIISGYYLKTQDYDKFSKPFLDNLENLNSLEITKGFLEVYYNYIAIIGKIMDPVAKTVLFQGLLSFIDSHRDKEFVGLTEFNIGSEYADKEIFTEAVKHYQNSLEIYEKHSTLKRQLIVIAKLQKMYAITHNHDATLASLEQEVDLRIKSDDQDIKKGLPNALFRLATSYTERSQGEKSLAVFQQALDVAEEIGDAVSFADVSRAFSRIQIIAKKYDEAAIILSNAIKRAKSAELQKWSIDLLYELGLLYDLMRKYQESIAVLSECLELARRFSIYEHVNSLQQKIAELRRKSGIYY